MNIGIIGSGNIGATAARLFAGPGHDVTISNSRGPGSLESLVAEIGPNTRAAAVEEAASFGEVILVAIPFRSYETLPATPLTGKVVDATNYYKGLDEGFAAILADDFEQISRATITRALIDELSANMLDDDEGTIPVFRYSDELIDYMNETEKPDPTDARDSLNDSLFDHLEHYGVWVPGKSR